MNILRGNRHSSHSHNMAGDRNNRHRAEKEFEEEERYHRFKYEEGRSMQMQAQQQSRSRGRSQPRDSRSMRHSNNNNSASREPTGVHETQVNTQQRRRHRQQQPSSLPFDDNGYCPLHPDVRMAKQTSRGGGWNVRLESCPKCHQGSKRQLSGDTESLTSEDSRGQHYQQRQQQQHKHGQDRRNKSQGPGRRPTGPGRQNSFRSSTNSNHSSQYNAQRISRGQQQQPTGGQRSRSRGGGRSRNQQRQPPKLQDQPPQSPCSTHLDHHCIDFDPNLNCRAPSRGTSRGSRRDRQRSLSRSSYHSRGGDQRSMGSRRSRNRRPSFNNKLKQKQHTPVCVNGRPFDKHGRCFVHSHVKLASKKMLGGWKIHMEYCPLCVNDNHNNYHDDDGSYFDDEDGTHSVISGMSRLTDDTGYNTNNSSYRSALSSRRSNKSSFGNGNGNNGNGNGCNASITSRRSMLSSTGGSMRSMKSTGSWNSGHSSKKRVKGIKDDSFLPLDEDGYCLQHPDVQLAKISKKGGWRVLMDFCPECAGDSLITGNNLISRKISTTSGNSSCKSSRSSRSNSSHSTYIESMPYIDGDGNKPGHYTGNVDTEGQPNGRGLMKYMNGNKFEGVWHEGTKLHGTKTTSSSSSKKNKKKKNNNSNKQTGGLMMRKNTIPPMTPPMAPTPPPTYPPLHVGAATAAAQSKKKNSNGKLTRKVSKHADEKLEDTHRISRRDLPPRGRATTYEEDDSTSNGGQEGNNGGRRPQRSLSRLRKKCDEIESLLRGYPSCAKETK